MPIYNLNKTSRTSCLNRRKTFDWMVIGRCLQKKGKDWESFNVMNVRRKVSLWVTLPASGHSFSPAPKWSPEWLPAISGLDCCEFYRQGSPLFSALKTSIYCKIVSVDFICLTYFVSSNCTIDREHFARW